MKKNVTMLKHLKALNPGVRFESYAIGELIQVIVCDQDSIKSLTFPKGFYVSPVYGLTNYGNDNTEVIKLPFACSPGAFSASA